MKKPEQYYCDFCGKQISESEDYVQVTIPVITNCDWTEGYPCNPRLETDKYDLCESCLLKTTNVKAKFQGQSPKFINE